MGTFELALCYDNPATMEYNPQQALHLYRVSYKLGYIRGLHKYGSYYDLGAQKGCKYCQFKLGEEFENGYLKDKNLETAFHWYKLSASNNFRDAQYQLSKMLYGITTTGREDLLEKYDKGGIQGKGILLAMLGKEKMLRFTDLEIAMHKQQIKIDLKKFYVNGIDRLKEAFKMAQMAAYKGNKEAVLLVAEALEKGFGTEKNLVECIKWYEVADALGCEN
ncbi:uncharacterized protein LOC143922057, partial [Arctopsyche grandis]|uniref:uncharacterized protein LOC143922057 n=1 Tax=Arctopsyche grandis TaxID=121162 RepID=UPI00406D9822